MCRLRKKHRRLHNESFTAGRDYSRVRDLRVKLQRKKLIMKSGVHGHCWGTGLGADDGSVAISFSDTVSGSAFS